MNRSLITLLAPLFLLLSTVGCVVDEPPQVPDMLIANLTDRMVERYTQLGEAPLAVGTSVVIGVDVASGPATLESVVSSDPTVVEVVSVQGANAELAALRVGLASITLTDASGVQVSVQLRAQPIVSSAFVDAYTGYFSEHGANRRPSAVGMVAFHSFEFALEHTDADGVVLTGAGGTWTLTGDEAAELVHETDSPSGTVRINGATEALELSCDLGGTLTIETVEPSDVTALTVAQRYTNAGPLVSGTRLAARAGETLFLSVAGSTAEALFVIPDSDLQAAIENEQGGSATASLSSGTVPGFNLFSASVGSFDLRITWEALSTVIGVDVAPAYLE